MYRKFGFLTVCTCSNDLQEYFFKVKRTKSKDGTSLTLELNTKQVQGALDENAFFQMDMMIENMHLGKTQLLRV